MRIIMLLLGFTVCAAAGAQDKKGSIRFRSVNSVGLLAGESRPAFTFQSVNGINKDRWFAGLGLALDYYQTRSFPVFIQLGRSLFPGRSPFVYANGGLNIPWTEENSELNREYQSGGYAEGGLGYRLPLKKFSLQFMAGYSYKSFSYAESYTVQCLIPPCPEFGSTYRYRLNRLAFRVGIGF